MWANRVSQTLRVTVRTGVYQRVFDASLLMLTRDAEGQLMLTFVANRQTHVVPYAAVLEVEVVK